MALINTADRIYLGATQADAVYAGATKVWPPVSTGAWGPDESIFAPASVPAAGGTDANTFATGNDIHIAVDGRITAIRYYRPTGSSTTRILNLWTNVGVLLATGTATSSVDGWNTFPLATPVIITGVSNVRVTHGYSGTPAGDIFPYTNSSWTSVSPDLAWNSGVYSPPFASGGQDDFPDTVTGLYTYYVDIVFQKKITAIPPTIAGLTVWLDASQLAGADGTAVSPWTDLSGAGNHGNIVSTPAPVVRANALNSKKVVRFTVNEGRVRGTNGIGSSGLPAPYFNYTIIYVSRIVGPYYGRVFSGLYPATNFLAGFHSSGMDCAYDGTAFIAPAVGYTTFPTAWKLYSMTGSHDGTTAADAFYSNGVSLGTGTGGTGLQDHYNLSGYDATDIQETCDCEVAELVIYNRPLTDPDRVKIENYLHSKWGV